MCEAKYDHLLGEDIGFRPNDPNLAQANYPQPPNSMHNNQPSPGNQKESMRKGRF